MNSSTAESQSAHNLLNTPTSRIGKTHTLIAVTDITHCLDEIRQALMCHLDSTLLASNGSGTWGDGQLRVCRDWEGLFDWVGDHGYVEVET